MRYAIQLLSQVREGTAQSRLLEGIVREYNDAFKEVSQSVVSAKDVERWALRQDADFLVAVKDQNLLGFTYIGQIPPHEVGLIAAAFQERDVKFDRRGRYCRRMPPSSGELSVAVHAQSLLDRAMRIRTADELICVEYPTLVLADKVISPIADVSNRDYSKMATVVLPRYRRNGIATRLTLRAEKYAAAGAKRMFAYVITPNPMIVVNERAGYQRIAVFPKWYANHADMTLMGKELKP